MSDLAPIEYRIARWNETPMVYGYALRTPAEYPQWIRLCVREGRFGWQVEHYDSGFIFGFPGNRPSRKRMVAHLWQWFADTKTKNPRLYRKALHLMRQRSERAP